MKKFLATLMTLALLLTSAAGLAETVPEINWEMVDIESTGIEGDWYTLNAVALQIWIPDTFEAAEITEEDGQIAFKTKGDANNTGDRLAVKADKVVGIYWKRIPKAGNVAMFMQTTAGLMLCVFLPLVLLIVYDMIRRRRFEKTHKHDTDALMKELEALRAQQAAKEAASQISYAAPQATKKLDGNQDHPL